jgi:hypothetical protein
VATELINMGYEEVAVEILAHSEDSGEWEEKPVRI